MRIGRSQSVILTRPCPLGENKTMSPKQKFIRWYVRPFNRLRRIPHGDGAYIALSIGFSLCERYYRIKSNTITKHQVSDPFLRHAARDYNCDVDLFKAFWNLFRHGIQHQGAPKKKYKATWLPGKPTVRINWAIGETCPTGQFTFK
jgi:hypothetical protein